jgi:hypothetical protein
MSVGSENVSEFKGVSTHIATQASINFKLKGPLFWPAVIK